MKNLFIPILLIFASIGCGTDVKPTAFIDMVRDPSDIDALSGCLSDEPTIDDKQITITLEKQCLIDFSEANQTDPTLAPSFAEIVANPEIYMDKLLTFEAVVKKIHHHNNVELYTNDVDLRFYITTHGAPLYRINTEGEEVPIEPNETYLFKCRIYQFHKNVDHGRTWEVQSEFIVSTSKKIVYLPELVE